MKRKAFACYEKNFSGQWKICVYWDQRPIKGISYNPERSQVLELNESHLREDGTVDLEKLQAEFPPPVEVADNTPKTTIR